MIKRHRFTVKDSENGRRLDHVISDSISGLSHKKAKMLVDKGLVYINGKRIRIASASVRIGDRIDVDYETEMANVSGLQPFSFCDKDILFNRDGMIAVNKPPGLLSQPGKDRKLPHVCSVLGKYLGSEEDLKITHRLDKETSGVLLVGRNPDATAWLMECFRRRLVEKEYHAICYGISKRRIFEERCFLGRIDENSGVVREVTSGGRDSRTKFEVIDEFKEEGLSLIRAMPVTGRSHQIRVHLEKNGLPIVGDKVYGGLAKQRLSPELENLSLKHHLLHCRRLTLPGVDGKGIIAIEAEYPTCFFEFIRKLRS
ncbi:MAG: RluA family pseudouridine synthase [Oligoflexales bacterium]|nr:RluA family pseudouridine synthase [Oligoflexales bacterium]